MAGLNQDDNAGAGQGKEDTIVPKPVPIQKPTIIKKEDTLGPKPVERREAVGAERPSGLDAPLKVELSKVKPVMPQLKGKPSEKLERIPKGKPKTEEKSKLVTVFMFLSLVFLSGGTALMVLQILKINLPAWLQPVLDFYAKIKIFPE